MTAVKYMLRDYKQVTYKTTWSRTASSSSHWRIPPNSLVNNPRTPIVILTVHRPTYSRYIRTIPDILAAWKQSSFGSLAIPINLQAKHTFRVPDYVNRRHILLTVLCAVLQRRLIRGLFTGLHSPYPLLKQQSRTR